MFQPQVDYVQGHVGARRVSAYTVDVEGAFKRWRKTLSSIVHQIHPHLVGTQFVYLEAYAGSHAHEWMDRRKAVDRNRVKSANHVELSHGVLGKIAECQNFYMHSQGITVAASVTLVHDAEF